jgi:hypothetical protein
MFWKTTKMFWKTTKMLEKSDQNVLGEGQNVPQINQYWPQKNVLSRIIFLTAILYLAKMVTKIVAWVNIYICIHILGNFFPQMALAQSGHTDDQDHFKFQ